MNAPVVQAAQLSQLSGSLPAGAGNNLELLMDVPLQVTVELGRTMKMVKEVLALGPGSVLELDKLAGEPVDILVNEKPIAKGEVVVIDENFGIRVTEILAAKDRISF
jgi:flagellar motor switch protein FliN